MVGTPPVTDRHHHDGPLASMSPVSKDLLAGTCAGMANILLCHPLDTIRVRMQTTTHNKFTSVSDLVRKTYVNEGLHGFYKGLSAPLVAQGIQKASMFFTFGICKRTLLSSSQQTQLNKLQLLACGGVAGGVTAIVASPIELIRNNLQVQYQREMSRARFTGPLHCASQIVKLNGVTALWTGTLPMVLRDVPGVAAWYYTFESVRQLLQQNVAVTSDGSVQLWKTALSGACAGVGYWTAAYPQDAIKSIIQTQMYHEAASATSSASSSALLLQSSRADSVLSVARRLVAEGGVSRLYRGYSASLMRGVIGASTTFTTYNVVINYFNLH